MALENDPSFIAYTVHSVEGRDVWEKIGAAWAHGEGKEGFNVLLQKVPARDAASGRLKIVLRGNQPTKPTPSAAAHDGAAGHVRTPHVAGGDCPTCQGKGIVLHGSRGLIACSACRHVGAQQGGA